MSTAAAGFPSWVMLEPFVFRRDDEEAFPDDTKAPIRASGTTSWGAPFRLAFSLAAPPLISRLYAHLPGFPDPREQVPLAILATHRHLALFRVAITTPEFVMVQDFFVYNATGDNPNSSLQALPPCTEPELDCTRRDGRQRRRRPPPPPQEKKRRLLTVRSMGILCRGGEDQFAVAELILFKPSRTEVYADICLFKSAAGQWSSMRVPILHNDDDPQGDIWQLCLWQTDAVIPVDGRWLCWIDYYRGMLFCDVFREPHPSVSFIRFPLVKFPDTHNRSRECRWLYRSAYAIDDDDAGGGELIKFVDVARKDHIGYGALMPGAGFTISCHTLTLSGSSKVWNKDYTVTSEELWSANTHERLPREILMFPQVNIDRPHVVHFLSSDFGYAMKKMWVVAIDMNTKVVESISQYTNGFEDIGTEDEGLTK